MECKGTLGLTISYRFLEMQASQGYPADQTLPTTEPLALNTHFEEAIVKAIYNLNSVLKKCLANPAALHQKSTCIQSTKIFEARLADLNFSDGNSRSLLIHLLFNEQYIATATKHGLSAAASTVSIDVDNFHIFEAAEFSQLVEHFEREGEKYVILPPAACMPKTAVSNVQKMTQHLHRAEQRVASLQETIHRLETEVNMRRESERIREEALRLQLEEDANKCEC